MLDSLYKMTRQIGDELAKISTEIAKGDFNFAEMLDVEDGILSEVFMGLEESIVEYPALIYDGPFSSALLEKEAKGLEGEEDITKEEGVTIINEMLEDLELKNVKYKGDCKSYFDCFNYEAETADGETVSIDLSVKGGKLISLNISRDVEEPKYSPEECALLAEQYAEDLGFEDMKSVWVSNYNSIIYVNLAPVVNDIVWYPDLVKIKIASNDGKLLGVEALSYTYNHIERNLSSPSVSESQARSAISASIKVETARLALIPYNGGTELLTYEFSGTSGDSVFYVYIDAETGEEVKVLRVIDSDEGTLLM
jgi:germination protein YpeB